MLKNYKNWLIENGFSAFTASGKIEHYKIHTMIWLNIIKMFVFHGDSF